MFWDHSKDVQTLKRGDFRQNSTNKGQNHTNDLVVGGRLKFRFFSDVLNE